MYRVIKASKSNTQKITSKSWSDFIRQIEIQWGYSVDSINRNKYNQFITLLKEGDEYEAEVTRYSDGTYELLLDNVYLVGPYDDDWESSDPFPIHSSTDLRRKRTVTAATRYDNFTTINHGRQKFSVHYSKGIKEGQLKCQISEIHPYDDADYAWAAMDFNGKVTFYQNGRKVDSMQMYMYDADDYESADDYFSDILDTIAVELLNINKNVKPRMMYN